MAPWQRRALPWLVWIVAAAPALAQVGLLAVTIARRIWYPYDLEWMEGGLLAHAHRIGDGEGIYGPPSVDFIPYLYTPLYPGLLATLGKVFGLSYGLGRVISVLSLCGIGGVAISITTRGAAESEAPVRSAALAGGLFACGLFAASYPYVEGWYDLVRADTLFLFMVTGGLALLYNTAGGEDDWGGQARTAAAAAILGLSFFAKQTGVIFVGLGFVILLIANWRRILTYVAVSGLIGLGGAAIFQRTTHGWFWHYAFEVHQAHDFNMDRFWMAHEDILWRYPAATVLIAITLIVIAATGILKRQLPREAWTFLMWTLVFAGSIEVGALGFGTEFAHKNAYMPALLHGAIAAGAAIPALAVCVPRLLEGRPTPIAPMWIGQAVAGAAAIALAWTCIDGWWEPKKWIPKAADRRAGAALVADIARVDGEVWVPSHPWYAHLAGKRMYAHQMSLKDVTARVPYVPGQTILGLEEALEGHRFAEIFLDNRDLPNNGFPFYVGRFYRKWDKLAKGEQPRSLTGAHVKPAEVWVPLGPALRPHDAIVVEDFEGGALMSWADGWTTSGSAWGNGPERGKADPDQGDVWRFGGDRWATSMHGGDEATGNLNSPPFELTGGRILMRLGGGTGSFDEDDLRVELLVDGEVVRTVYRPAPPSERFSQVAIDVKSLPRGSLGRLRFVDEATGAWGHLNVDEIWVLPD